MSSSIPLWLELRPEYIDANFEKVSQYIKSQCIAGGNSEDMFFQQTLTLLDKRVENLLEEQQGQEIFNDEQQSRKSNIFNIKLLGLWLLARKEDRSILSTRVFFALALTLAREVRYEAIELSDALLNVVCNGLGGDLPFGWDELLSLQDDSNCSTLAYKVARYRSKSGGRKICYENNGSLCAEGGTLTITPLNLHDADIQTTTASFQVLENQVSIESTKDLKLKQSRSNDLCEIDSFVGDYTKSMLEVKPHVKPKHIIDTVVEVQVTGISNGHVCVRTTSSRHQVEEGIVVLELKTLMLYGENDFCRLMGPGMIFKAKYISPGKFSIKETFVKFLSDKCDIGQEIPARLEFIGKRYTWWTENGYTVYTESNDDYHHGDYAWVYVDKVATNNIGFINGEIVEPIDIDSIENEEDIGRYPFNDSKCKDYGFDGFARKGDLLCVSEEDVQELTPDILQNLYRIMLLCQGRYSSIPERYKLLKASEILSVLIGNESDRQYISFLADYLEALDDFSNASGKVDYSGIKIPKMPDALRSAPSIRKKADIVRLVKSYGPEPDMDFVESCISEDKTDIQTRLALLIQSAHNLGDVINKNISASIKQEIKHILSFSDDGEEQMWDDSRICLGTESSILEFKSSFFEAPTDAAEQDQKMTIFKNLCGFMNTEHGGTLYLGVNDAGYINGIERDLNKLVNIGNRAYARNVESYCRYIQDEAKKWFTQGAIMCLQIRGAYEDQVVEIVVSPFRHGGVVEFNGMAYVRVNAETLKMAESTKRTLMSRRKRNDNGFYDKETALSEAIAGKLCVTLERYSSSNSGQIADRDVEPFAFTDDGLAVWCYEPIKAENKTFKISRIGNVLVREKKWTWTVKHKVGSQDIFKMTGVKPRRIVLSMTLRAKNCLVEEYPAAGKFLSEDKNSGRWFLDTDIYQMEGAGRFVLGFASEIEIIKGNELKEYIKKYASDHIGRLVK